MLVSLELENYQSHKHTKLDIGKYTCIVGRSSSGKSSIIRALQLLANNARGSSYVRQGTKQCRVTLTQPECAISVVRGNNTSVYEQVTNDSIEPFIFRKCGTSVPEQISKALAIPPTQGVWLARQFDRPALLDETGSQVAKVIGELTNVSIIYAAVKEGNRQKLEVSRELKLVQAELAQAELEKQSYVGLPEQLVAIARAASAAVVASDKINKAVRCEATIAGVGAATEALATAQRARVPVADIASATEALAQAESLCHVLDNLASAQLLRDGVVIKYVPNITTLVSTSDEYMKLAGLVQSAESSKVRVLEERQRLSSTKLAVEEIKEKLSKVKVCPTCGQGIQ